MTTIAVDRDDSSSPRGVPPSTGRCALIRALQCRSGLEAQVYDQWSAAREDLRREVAERVRVGRLPSKSSLRSLAQYDQTFAWHSIDVPLQGVLDAAEHRDLLKVDPARDGAMLAQAVSRCDTSLERDFAWWFRQLALQAWTKEAREGLLRTLLDLHQ